MKNPRYDDSERDFEFEQAAAEEQKEFEEWCNDNEMDPEDDEAKEFYKEYLSEVDSWEGMDPDDRTGWEDNMIKWGE